MRALTLRKTLAALTAATALAFATHAFAANGKDDVVRVGIIANAKTAIATFAGGCFWTMEHAFDDVPGVLAATSGYSGGHVANPSYEQVSTGNTGHVESVQVRFDPAKVSYAHLLDIYFHRIDPTQVGGQACDHGDEYRSVIFVADAVQLRQAQAYMGVLEKSGLFHAPLAVQLRAADAFYPAEGYHQHFAQNNPAYYERYRVGCGRDRRLQAVWGKAFKAY
ncbi:MAG: peptide-methionine (S)-S-oxide reductase MsrA [Proteobacteria bacterium]|nr:peptide-methionine (S)-S-oxide reductase MsrA [Pseudomonadota bacterium]MBS0463895.1 peptide-methionine (S)-S-oxide reductase MsrA [Pseudomonadota bacterium]